MSLLKVEKARKKAPRENYPPHKNAPCILVIIVLELEYVIFTIIHKNKMERKNQKPLNEEATKTHTQYPVE